MSLNLLELALETAPQKLMTVSLKGKCSGGAVSSPGEGLSDSFAMHQAADGARPWCGMCISSNESYDPRSQQPPENVSLCGQT